MPKAKWKKIPRPVEPPADEDVEPIHPSLVPRPVRADEVALRTMKRKLFLHEYLIDRNLSAAAQRAGISVGCASRWLRTDPEIRARLDVALVQHQARAELRADDLVRELATIALADLGQAFDKDGEILPIHEIPEGTRRAISEYTTDERWVKDEKVGVKRKVKLWSKNEAAIALLRMMVEAEEAKRRLLETMSDEELYEKAQAALAKRGSDAPAGKPSEVRPAPDEPEPG